MERKTKKEIVSFFGVSGRLGESRIIDFGLKLYEGEILFLVDEEGQSFAVLKGILEGRYSAYEGRVNWGEQMVQGVEVLDDYQRFSDALTVAGNLYGLDATGGVFFRHRQRIRADALLRGIGLPISADTRVRDLSAFQKRLLGFARAKKRNIRFLILDCGCCLYGEKEFEELKRYITKAAAYGCAVLILAREMNSLQFISHRAVWVKKGRECMYFQDTEMDKLGAALRRATGEIFIKEKTKKQIPPDWKILGICDPEWAMDETMIEYLHRFFERNPEMELLSLKERKREIIYVPIDSGEHLLEEASLAENLTIAILPRISHFGIINKRVQKYIGTEFSERFLIDERISVRSMTAGQKTGIY